jgi:hypothetical protein
MTGRAYSWSRAENNENTPPEEQITPQFTRGYFAFPPGRVTLGESTEGNGGSSSYTADSKEGNDGQEKPWEERKRSDEEARKKRLEVEEEIANKGEVDWVR